MHYLTVIIANTFKYYCLGLDIVSKHFVHEYTQYEVDTVQKLVYGCV